MTTTTRTTRHDLQSTASRRRPTMAPAHRHEREPMPRSTTRVIWTISQGASVQYGDIA